MMIESPGPGASYSPCCVHEHRAGTRTARNVGKASDYTALAKCNKCGAESPPNTWLSWNQANALAREGVAA